MGKMKKSSFLEGAFIATVCIVISKILGIVYVIPFYRIIGEDGGALYGYAYSIYNIFLNISSVGIPFAICKLTSEYTALGEDDRKTRMYRIATRMILVFSVISFLVCFGFAPQFAKLINVAGGNSRADVVLVIRSISFTLLIVPLLSVKRGFLQGHKYISQPSTSQVVEQFVRVAVILGGSALCVYLLKLPLRWAVSVSVLAAGVGGLASYVYLDVIVRKNRTELCLDRKISSDRAADKLILRDILLCAIPFVIINLADSLYASTDMVLILRTLPKLDFSAHDTEFVSSVFTTWGTKFNAILSAVSVGLITSLIPNIVSDFTLGKMKEVNENLNKCLKIILLIILPLACFISVMAEGFWNFFYAPSAIGPSVIRFSILVTVFNCLYMILNSLLQSLNRKQIIYIGVISGLGTNLLLDVPFMYLFRALELPAYYGAILATFCGFLISNGLSLWYLGRKMKVSYTETARILPRVIGSLAVVIAVGLVLRHFLPVGSASKLMQVGNLALTGIVCGGIWFVLNRRPLLEVLPEGLARRLHFGKNT